MKITYIIFFSLLAINSFAQKNPYKKHFINLTVGRISFGTGDFLGYGANIEFTKRLNMKTSILKHFSIGTELAFENGSKQPKVINPTFIEFISKNLLFYD